MPQMSPLNWMWLFIIFSTSYMMIMIINYFLQAVVVPDSTQLNMQPTANNWKW